MYIHFLKICGIVLYIKFLTKSCCYFPCKSGDSLLEKKIESGNLLRIGWSYIPTWETKENKTKLPTAVCVCVCWGRTNIKSVIEEGKFPCEELVETRVRGFHYQVHLTERIKVKCWLNLAASATIFIEEGRCWEGSGSFQLVC